MDRSRMLFRILLLVAPILLVADAAASRSLRVMPSGPDPLDSAKAVFEATVVSFVAPKGDEPGRVRLLVTSDWRRIYRGFSVLGRTIDVPFRGPQFPSVLTTAKGAPGARMLYAIDATTDEVAMVASRLANGRFHVTARAPVDHQSAQQWSSGGGTVWFTTRSGYSGQYLETQLKARFWNERSSFLDSVAKATHDAAKSIDAAALDRLVEDLGASDFTARDRAHRDLVAAGSANVTALRAAIARLNSLETRRRLARIERQIALQQALRRTRAAIAGRGSSVDGERKELGPRTAPKATSKGVFFGGGIRRR